MGRTGPTAAADQPRARVEPAARESDEAPGLGRVAIVMVGAVIAERDDSNLSIPLFVDMMAPRGRAMVNLAVGLVSIGDLTRWVVRHQELEIRDLIDNVQGAYTR